ncbi:retropepsin-like aspartic protease [Granulosicoccaceae sp. 1_MG-2023]|nr:retropepsin-like aspartic protease [Granulosicoccaceae sp. 1_MG-2023]
MRFLLATALLVLSSASPAQEGTEQQIPMHSRGTNTWYIDSAIADAGRHTMLVDTGSGYSVINEETLARLIESGEAEYVSKLRGKMADGSERIVPLYRIASITLGEHCVIHDINAAVLPRNSRQIIGISTLARAGSFSMSFDPPLLTLSDCTAPAAAPENAFPAAPLAMQDAETQTPGAETKPGTANLR